MRDGCPIDADVLFITESNEFPTGELCAVVRDDGVQTCALPIYENHTRVDWADIVHPRTNGQVERANGMLLQGLKPWIFNRLNKFGTL